MPRASSGRRPRTSRHWLVIGAVAVSLAILTGLQLRTHAQLEETSVVAYRVTLRGLARGVLLGIEDFYRRKADEALRVPPELLARGREDALAAHFARQDAAGVRRFFTVTFADADRAPIRWFAPDGRALAEAPDAGEAQAATVAGAAWRIVAEQGSRVGAIAPTVHEQDPGSRVILRPILDAARRVAGVAGLVVDTRFLLEERLPALIEQERALLPPAIRDDVTVAVRPRRTDPVALANVAAAGEVEASFKFVLTDQALAVSGRDVTPAQWARSSSLIGVSLSLATTGVLVIAVLLALRGAARATRLSQMKTEFVSNVSHELRTPLASIRVFGEFLRQGRVEDPGKVREYGEYIEAESRRLTNLVNNILDFARIESGRKEYRFETVDLAELTREALETLEVRLRQDGFSVELRGADAPRPVWADPTALGQALTNLLDNAIKYSGDARTIEVELSRDASHVSLAIRDRGPGIAREEQGRIFDKFYRVGTSLVHDVKGSGLGLAIVKAIADAHGGEVGVRSQPGAGSTFTLRLPAHAG
jgi:signal transduction histidine kinase